MTAVALARAALLALALAVGAGTAVAQSLVPLPGADTAADAPAEESGADAPEAEPQPLPAEIDGVDLEEWEDVAARAETVLARGGASVFALTQQRSVLFTWRDRFQALEGLNAARLRTIDSQLEALGPIDADTPGEVLTRRDALDAQRRNLAAPGRLAAEAFARADGLIAETDTALRAYDTRRLTTRGPTPLNPAAWPVALAQAGGALADALNESRALARVRWDDGRLPAILPTMGVLALVGLVLLGRGRRWVLAAQARVGAWSPRGQRMWAFLISLWQVILPALGLSALLLALLSTGVLGLRGQGMLTGLLGAGLAIIAARWLAGLFFPPTGETGPLRHDPADRARLRRLALTLGWVVGALTLVDAVLPVAQSEPIDRAVARLPFQVLMGITLFRFGALLRNRPARPAETGETAPPPSETGGARPLVALAAMVVAVAGPLLAALGYAAAADALLIPAVLTLALLGIVMLLQRFVADVFDMWADPGSETGPLAPILIGFVLSLVALPFLALIWGARTTDLVELYAQFSAGFTFGTVTISPGGFLRFVIIFALGYLITQFLRGTLKASVMPRTKLDLGGQNAVLAGVTYTGILLSALIAISVAGFDLSSIAIVAGALSVGIGFGLQTIVQNFISGIILLVERPIGEGDWIEVNGQMGYVRDISVRATRIETFDRRDVIIPNADLITGQVTNWTRGNTAGRVIVKVGVAYGTDTQRVEALLTEIARAHPMVLHNPPPSIFFMNFGDSALNFEIRAIIRDVTFSFAVLSELNHTIAARFAEEGIEVPFPQRDLWLRNAEALRAAAGEPAPAPGDTA